MELFKGQEKEQEDSVALISAHDQEWRDTEFLQQQPRNKICHRLMLAGVLCTMIFGGMIIGALFTAPMLTTTTTTTSEKAPRNIIFMISDGMGPASVSFARSYYQYINKLPYDYQMPLDTIHVGQSRTRSSSTLVTDSAAGATAFSCGLKTYNGAVGVAPDGHPCGTILEAAKHQLGMKTGLVATSRITHATPASWSAHVIDRDDEDNIAVQQVGDNPIGRSVDLMFGGGYCHFLPKEDPRGCRKDNRNVLEESTQTYGWRTVIVENRTTFDEMPMEDVLPAIALFSSDHMSYEIDRDATIEPSLTEMTKKALDILTVGTASQDKGFFLMVEGSRIDMAAHSNDPAAHLHDILEYQNAVALVKEYVDQHPDTFMISTSDHETGGLSLARQVSAAYPKYLWFPDVLANVKSSTAALAKELASGALDVQKAISELGISDATKEELSAISKSIHSTSATDKYLSDMISIRAELGWATHGHSGVDVNLYAYGQWSDRLVGNHENTYLGQFLADVWNLNLTDTTELLNANDSSFHVKTVTDDVKKSYIEHLDKYNSNPALLHHYRPFP